MTTSMFKTGMNRSLLNRDFFQTILDRAYGPCTVQTKSWLEEELDSSSSILSNISSGDGDDEDSDDEEDGEHHSVSLSPQEQEPCPMNDMTGHFLYKIEYTAPATASHPQLLPHLYHPALSSSSLSLSSLPSSGSISIAATSHTDVLSRQSSSDTLISGHDEESGELRVVIKSKPIDTALIELTNIMAQLQGGDLADEYEMVKDLTGFKNSHIREMELAELSWQVQGPMEQISTKVYNVLRNDPQQLYALCLEYLDPSQGNITHLNSTEDALTLWSPDDIHLVLRDLASFHAQFLGQEGRILGMSFLENPTRTVMKTLRPTYEAMIKTNGKNEPELFSSYLTETTLEYLAHSDEHWVTLEQSPRTLIHGDFNTRNICMRLDPSTGAQSLCAYDWELACCQVPQRDVVEFLAFVLPPGSNTWSHYIEYHRLALKNAFERQQGPEISSSSSKPRPVTIPSPHEYAEVAKIALLDFASLRVAMYGISNSFKRIDWLPRVLLSVEEQLKRMGPLRPRHHDKVFLTAKM
ncbi:hypothetical protein BGZ83_000764 [Gryganskiella cystojenkinii]|nr:hypothetical protein BGZ83_000764 [Gryganskiella cystojenkinii]